LRSPDWRFDWVLGARGILLLVAIAAGTTTFACRRDTAGGAPETRFLGDTSADSGSADAHADAAPVATGDAGDAPDASSDARVVGWKIHKETRGGRNPVTIAAPKVTTTRADTDAELGQAIEGVLAARTKAFLADARGEAQCRSGEPGGRCAMPVDCAVALARGRGVSVRCDATPDLGGAHPSKVVFAMNYVLAGAHVRAIGIDDLAVDAKTKRRLLKKALARLDAKEGAGLADLVGEGVFSARDVPFTIEKNGGVRIVFVDLPFAVGPQDVRLSAAEVRGLVRPEVMAAFE